MFSLLLLFTFMLFQFDETGFAAAAVPIALAIIGLVAAWGFDLSKSRVATLFGLMATIYAAAAPYLNLMQSGKLRIAIIIIGVLCTALNRSLVTSGTLNKAATLIIVGALLISSAACGPPSRQTIQTLYNGANQARGILAVNENLPEQLLDEHLIDAKQYVVVKEAVAQVRQGVNSVSDGLAIALTAETPSLKALAPIVANIIAQLRVLRAFANPKVQTFLSAFALGFQVIGTYFALQIAEARQAGYTDQQICAFVGLPYDSKRFELLAAGV